MTEGTWIINAIGTVIGSAPFNLCCICGGAALAVGGTLKLDPWTTGRELIALIGAMMLFLWALGDAIVQW